jgi:hypothetical protein
VSELQLALLLAGGVGAPRTECMTHSGQGASTFQQFCCFQLPLGDVPHASPAANTMMLLDMSYLQNLLLYISSSPKAGNGKIIV